MRLRATVWHVLAAALAVMFALLGASPSAAATHASTYDSPSYVYDAPALLSSQSAAASYVRGSPSGPEAVPWASPVFVARGVVAANTAPRLLSPSSLADEVANATGGVLKTNKGGFTIDVPNGARGISVRVMERGGSRTNYYRVSVPGKETYTVTGEASTDAALTHMDIGESSLDDILSIIARIQGAG